MNDITNIFQLKIKEETTAELLTKVVLVFLCTYGVVGAIVVYIWVK